MRQKFLILGGDLRNIKLAEMLNNDNNKVFSYGLENSKEMQENSQIEKIQNLANAMDKVDIIIAPTPFSIDNENINSPFSSESIKINQLLKNNKNKIFIAGGIKDKIKEQLEENYLSVIDVMKREELAILNTIATAEGAIEVAIKNTDKILQGSKVLILGFGRVAKIVANKFSMLSTNVTCAARKISDLAWIQAYGYEAININDMLYDLKDFDIIINTVPQIIIKEKELKHMKSDVLLIDLASAPGGMDFDIARQMEINCVWALALPGKIAPVSSAKFIKEAIYNILEENGKKENENNVEKRDEKMEKNSKKV